MLCWFLPYNSVNQPKVYMRPLPLQPPPTPHPTLLGCHGGHRLSFLCCAAASHWPSILHMVMYMFSASLEMHPILPFPCCVHTSGLYVCVSVPALQIVTEIF